MHSPFTRRSAGRAGRSASVPGAFIRSCSRVTAMATGLLFGAAATLGAQTLAAQTTLSPPEQRMREWIRNNRAEQIATLERAVNIGSGTMNAAGVREVGQLFRAAFDSLGFNTRWASMPDSVNRAGHLVAERRGRAGAPRILLIGHLDTVFEGPAQRFAREDSMGRGAGTSDDKGGDVVILHALEALQSVGALDSANITVVLTGDEESAGSPLSISRGDLVAAARQSDIALAFEGGSKRYATVARRGASSWVLRVTGRQAHSSGIFGSETGYGAIFEAARILDGFRTALAGEKYLTFNPGIIVGGTDVTFDSARVSGTAASKLNIIARTAIVPGDLRFISDAQKDSARSRMRAIVAKSLPQTSAEIGFQDEYPAMSPTAANYRLLAVYDSASRALGYGPVEALDPGERGAGDVSFVAPYVAGLDGLGPSGRGGHTPSEQLNLNSLVMQTERAAVLLYRLTTASGTAAGSAPAARGPRSDR